MDNNFLAFFVVFHEDIFPNIYKNISKKNLDYLYFYGVKKETEHKVKQLLYERELPIYEPIWQKLKYNEASSLIHIYKNNFHKNYKYIGFIQYDMKITNETFDYVEYISNHDSNAIFYFDFFKWAFLGGQITIIKDFPQFEAGLKTYNRFFNTDITPFQLIQAKMNIGNTFIISSQLFDKMMSWLSQYCIENMNLDNLIDKENNIPFNPGHIFEALTGMFFAAEVVQGNARYYKLACSDYNDKKYDNEGKVSDFS